jgi:hypothetical protein
MRLGCGCLLVCVLAVVLVGGLGWGIYQASLEPAFGRPEIDPADAQRAQEKIYAVVSQSRSRGRVVELTESEVNAFLARNVVEIADLPLSDLRASLSERNRVRLAGRTSLGGLMTEPPLTAVRDVMPASWLTGRIWLQLVATPKIERTSGRRRYLRLEIEEFAIGRQRLPTIFVRLMLDPTTARLLRWPIPETIEEITIGEGRAVVRPAS